MRKTEGKFSRGLAAKKGQTTLEILIALAIFTLSVAGLISLVGGGQSLTLDSGQASRASSFAEESLNEIRTLARYNFQGIQSTSTSRDGFTINIAVSSTDNFTKEVVAKVSWQTDPLRTQQIELKTEITDIQSANNLGGDTGGAVPFGDWKNPKTLGSIDLGPGEAATGLDVLNKIVYMSAVASDAKKPDFFVVDATNGRSPQIVASIDTGPGLNAVDAVNGYAYAANNNTSNQLQVINTASENNPVLAANFTLPGVSGKGAVGRSVYFYGNRIYIGTGKASGPEFHIVDVGNPNSPAELGSFDIGADVNAVRVVNGVAYLATSDADEQLKILDVSNPSAVKEIGRFAAAGGNAALSVYVSGTTAYLGLGGASGNFYILDASNPANVKIVGSANISGSVTGIVVSGGLAFLGTTDANNEFQVWYIANPSSPVLWSSFNFPNVASGIDYENNLVYVSVRSNDALRIITSGP